jgi:hypothetical protein
MMNMSTGAEQLPPPLELPSPPESPPKPLLPKPLLPGPLVPLAPLAPLVPLVPLLPNSLSLVDPHPTAMSDPMTNEAPTMAAARPMRPPGPFFCQAR